MRKQIKNRYVDIILPYELGDSIMSFPLIKSIQNENFSINILKVSRIQKELFQYFFNDTLLIDTPSKHDVLIDFRCDEATHCHQLFINNYQESIGFCDYEYEFQKCLKLPKEYLDRYAHEIYLYALDLLNIKRKSITFNSFNNWKKSNQVDILLMPGTGHRNKSISIEVYKQLYKLISKKYSFSVKFLFGPQEKNLFKLLKHNYDCVFSKSVKTTFNMFQKSKLVIVNEGGAMHLACVFGIPNISVFHSESPKNWFPYPNKRNRQIVVKDEKKFVKTILSKLELN